MSRSYNGGGPPLEYSTISGHRCTFLFAEYSTKESSTSPTFLVLKVPLEVLQDFGTTLLTTGMYLLDPFSKKRRSPLDLVSRRTLIVLCWTISLSLVSFGGGSASFRHFLDQFRSNFFNLYFNLVTGFYPVWYSSVPDCPKKNILGVVPFSTVHVVHNYSKIKLILQTLECKKCLFFPLKMMAFRYLLPPVEPW
jgi:hypothetical protein